MLDTDFIPILAVYAIRITRFLRVVTSKLFYLSSCHPESASLPPLSHRESALESQLLLAPPASPSLSIYSHLLHLRCLIPLPFEVLLEASQATTFESQLRDSRPRAEIVTPADSSKEATIASSNVADKATKRLDQNFEDNYDGIDWLRLLRFTKPLTTSRRKPSWIY
jgi:hypothetical protein